MSIADISQVAEVRRRAVALAGRCGLDETDGGRLALVVTEMATNAVRHAAGGEMLLRAAVGPDGFVESICIDRGPGMADAAACMRDGFSTGSTPGIGLGAIRRQSDAFDLFTAFDRGTAVLSRIGHRRAGAASIARPAIAAICLAKAGEDMSGDAWSVVDDGPRTWFLVADGLGHGPLAADAALAAVRIFQKSPRLSPAELVERIHLGLRATRGAAVAVALVDRERRSVTYCGLGNIAACVTSGGEMRRMVSHNGTAGLRSTRIRDFDYPFSDEPVLLMHSDGLATSWSFDAYPGLLSRDPSLIAAVLLRDHERGRDDVTVLATTPGAR